MKSSTKGGGLMTRPCRPQLGLFPVSLPPDQWEGCGSDVYKYTWNSDTEDLLVFLSSTDRLKLTRTMGFCPHMRCQLDDVQHSVNTTGHCPQGLCYTKIEHGALSFGACCFTENKFSTSQLLGFYNKTQQTPKPIYRHSRIILGRKSSNPLDDLDPGTQHDEYGSSYDSFINANRVAPGIIATQCPLPSTVSDAKRMIIEQNVSLWVQLSPFSESADHLAPSGRDCDVFPLRFSQDDPGVKEVARTASMHYDTIRYNLTAYTRTHHAKPGYSKFTFHPATGGTVSSDDETWRRHENQVEHVWFHRWPDFETPARAHQAALLSLADHAASIIRKNGTIVVSCVSGRGRTGTFSALVQARLQGTSSVSDLVDIIVDMRRRRDGLVETPRQFHMVAALLGLNMTPRDALQPSIAPSRVVGVWEVCSALCLGLLVLMLVKRR